MRVGRAHALRTDIAIDQPGCHDCQNTAEMQLLGQQVGAKRQHHRQSGFDQVIIDPGDEA